jgi:flavin-dependent dehydrogenase
VRKLGLEESIEQVHDEAVFHTRRGVLRFRLPYRFCTFDYRTFCRLLLDRFDGDLLSAAATGVTVGARGETAVVTDAGVIEGNAIVDATGWRATLACSVDPGFPAHAEVTYGLELPCVGFEDDGLHFWFDREIRGDGYAWAFPAGGVARAGVLSYVAPGGVRDSTARFLERERLEGDHWHGGFLTAGLRPATADGIFLVGDSAGHCLPFSGEGIRPAVFFAQRLATLLNGERDGARTRSATVAAYDELQGLYTRRYRWLRRAQRVLRGWPDPPVGMMARALTMGALYRYATRLYWEVAAPIEPVSRFRSTVAERWVEVPA